MYKNEHTSVKQFPKDMVKTGSSEMAIDRSFSKEILVKTLTLYLLLVITIIWKFF